MRFWTTTSKPLSNILRLAFRNLEGNRILEAIGLEVAASAGAACQSLL
ncbi:MAG: hypothetical protein WCD46_02725 [Desulfobacterales bacterium]